MLRVRESMGLLIRESIGIVALESTGLLTRESIGGPATLESTIREAESTTSVKSTVTVCFNHYNFLRLLSLVPVRQNRMHQIPLEFHLAHLKMKV